MVVLAVAFGMVALPLAMVEPGAADDDDDDEPQPTTAPSSSSQLQGVCMSMVLGYDVPAWLIGLGE